MKRTSWLIGLAIVFVIFLAFMGCQKNQPVTENTTPPPPVTQEAPVTPPQAAPAPGTGEETVNTQPGQPAGEVKEGEKVPAANPSEVQSQQPQTEGEQVVVMYVCPTHPQVKQDKPGKCPQCGAEMIILEEGQGK